MRISDDVALVGGSTINGFGLSGGMDSHIYVIDGGGPLALIDCGMASGDSIERIEANMRGDGLDPDRLEWAFITHYHVDHVGGLSAWQETHDVRGAIGVAAAAAVESADVEATGFRLARKAGVYPSDYVFRPGRIDRPLRHGEVIEVGELTVEFVATPGHCAGHGCYLVSGRGRRHLFTGDCVFHGGKIALLNTDDSDLRAYRSTVLHLATLEFDAMLPGHGALAVDGGKDHVDKAAAAFRTLSVPASVV